MVISHHPITYDTQPSSVAARLEGGVIALQEIVMCVLVQCAEDVLT